MLRLQQLEFQPTIAIGGEKAKIKDVTHVIDFTIIKTMKIKGIKRGKTIEIFQEIDIPDGQEIIIYTTYEESTKVVNNEAKLYESIEKFRQEENLEKAEIEPEIFADVRDKSLGREMIL
ncbi:hypothetical protein [Calothrix sp. CCY 0018]|uniref:hypothetical protein n=1 Tax=Calothrix sp. CCY 0018 TaxID=3103864 RepID=UPI0039C6B0A5